jgi:hypothetical protein
MFDAYTIFVIGRCVVDDQLVARAPVALALVKLIKVGSM